MTGSGATDRIPGRSSRLTVVVTVLAAFIAGGAASWLFFSQRSGGSARETWFPFGPADGGSGASTVDVRLYYPGPSDDRLVAFQTTVPHQPTREELIRALIEQLVAEPPTGLGRVAPAGAELLDVFIDRREVVYLDLGRTWVDGNPRGTRSELITLGALVSTVLENVPRVTGVRILVDGQTPRTLAGHVALDQVFRRSPYPTEDDPGFVRIEAVDDFGGVGSR